jgi:aryl-alcohol dehydrogenase-like predicted oxidoreductase
MKTAALGSLEVSVIGLGCNNFGRALDQDGTQIVVSAALDAGITFFDTASNYGEGQSEGFLGSALGSRRDEAVIGTKFGLPVSGFEQSGGARPDYVHAGVERALRQLRTDRIDLLQIHFPDPDTPIEDTLGAMAELVEQGKVLEIGCSNFDAVLTKEANDASASNGFPLLVSNQIEYSILERKPEETGLVAQASSVGIALLPYYPLASGMLTGKKRKGEPVEGRLNMDRYSGYLTDRSYDIVEGLRTFAEQRGVSMAALALAWLLAQPAVPTVTPGATKPEQIDSNVAAADIELSDDDLAEIESIVETAS